MDTAELEFVFALMHADPETGAETVRALAESGQLAAAAQEFAAGEAPAPDTGGGDEPEAV